MTTVAREEPYAVAVVDQQLDKICSNCLKKIHVRRCAKCKTLYYCSPSCQQEDWKDHKKECSIFAAQKSDFFNCDIRLMIRMIFRARREEQSDDKAVSFNGRTIDDLMDNYEHFVRNPNVQQTATKFYEVLCESGKLNFIQSPDEIVKYYGKLRTNMMDVATDGLIFAKALYLGFSVHDHSCIPNAFIIFGGRTAVMRVPEKNADYSTEYCISYIDLMQPTASRQEALLKDYFFVCECRRCLDFEADALAQSVRCIYCVDDVCPLYKDIKLLQCRTCGRSPLITYEEAVDMNFQMAAEIDANVVLGENNFDVALSMYKRFRLKCSPYNVRCARLAVDILDCALNLGDEVVGAQYATDAVIAHKRFCPMGSPMLSRALYLAACAAGARKNLEGAVEAIEEATEAIIMEKGADALVIGHLTQMKHHTEVLKRIKNLNVSNKQ